MTETTTPLLAGMDRQSVTRRAILAAIDRECRAGGVGTQSAIARRLVLTPSDISHARRLSDGAVDKVAAALGYRRHAWAEQTYVRVAPPVDGRAS